MILEPELTFPLFPGKKEIERQLRERGYLVVQGPLVVSDVFRGVTRFHWPNGEQGISISGKATAKYAKGVNPDYYETVSLGVDNDS